METLQLPHSLSTQLKRQKIIEALVRQRYSLNPNYFDPALVTALRHELIGLADEDDLHAARIGKAAQRTRRRAIRGDAIHWLNGATPAQRAFLEEMDGLQMELNRQLFLGLEELEAHFAHYAPGSSYQTHLDSFQNNNLRRITIVAYLNQAWQGRDGGALQLYDGEKPMATVLPQGGTLICFVSEEIPHQVVTTRRDRYSIAGWFRVRDPQQLPAARAC